MDMFWQENSILVQKMVFFYRNLDCSELNEKLQKILHGKNEKELPMGEEASRKAVYIMNAHQAKGGTT